MEAWASPSIEMLRPRSAQLPQGQASGTHAPGTGSYPNSGPRRCHVPSRSPESRFFSYITSTDCSNPESLAEQGHGRVPAINPAP